MDDVLEKIHIALTGATSLLRRIYTGNIRLVPALKKKIEAAMDAINTHRIDDTVVPNNVHYQGHPATSGRGGKVVSKTVFFNATKFSLRYALT